MVYKEEQYKEIEFSSFTIYWKGFFYADGYALGKESVLYIGELVSQSKAIDFDSLKGHFVLGIEYNDGKKVWFSDNSGIYRLYKRGEDISDSFLQLARKAGNASFRWNTNQLIEFAHWGFVYGSETLVEGVGRISSKSFLSYDGEQWQVKSKQLQDFEQPNPNFDLESYFQELQQKLSKTKLSLDITGGLDSRYLLCWFKNTSSLELCVSGYGESIDQKIATQVAEVASIQLHNVQHHTNDFSTTTLEDIVADSDGLLNVMVFHRLNQYYKARKERGVELAMQGGGGEIFGDHWWLQDFPFYTKVKFSIASFARLRLFSNTLNHAIFSADYRVNSENLFARKMEQLEHLRGKNNTQTWDKIAYYFKHHNAASAVMRFYAKNVNVYAPYLEREVHRFGYHMPRKKRMFDQLQIKHLQKYFRSVCSIPTTRGPHLNYNPSNFIQAIFFVFTNRIQRLVMKMNEVLFKATYDRNKLDNPDLSAKLRNSTLAIEAFVFWQKEGVINADLTLEDLNDQYLSNWVSLFLIQKNIHSTPER